MGATKQNLATFNQGIKRAVQMAKPNLLNAGLKIAKSLVEDAIRAYRDEDANLTGNLINSIAGGVYVNGFFEGYVSASNFVQPEVHTYANVGSKGFKVWGSNEELLGGFVHQYREGLSFQPTIKGGTGRESALEFLSQYRPKSKVFEVAICAAAPYAKYLQNVRGLDVLTTAFQNGNGTWNTYIATIKKI